MNRKTRAIALMTAAATLSLVTVTTSVAAPPRPSSPMLFLRCDRTPTSLVNCQLSGIGFRSREGIAVTYQVTFLKAEGPNGRSTYRRQAVTDGQGDFVRPPLRFFVTPPREGYVVDVTAAGSRGDRATVWASSAKLMLACTSRTGGQVSCRLVGQHFLPVERVAITYRITFADGSPTATYHRETVTSTQGAFARPPLHFTTQHSYQVDVQATGAKGDRATIRGMGMAN